MILLEFYIRQLHSGIYSIAHSNLYPTSAINSVFRTSDSLRFRFFCGKDAGGRTCDAVRYCFVSFDCRRSHDRTVFEITFIQSFQLFLLGCTDMHTGDFVDDKQEDNTNDKGPRGASQCGGELISHLCIMLIPPAAEVSC